MRLADPTTGHIPPGIFRREKEFARRLPDRRGSALKETAEPDAAAKMLGWVQRGPRNVGGRTRALAIDVSDPTYRTLLAGGVSGGMWRTSDDGATWSLTTGSTQLHSVTTVAQDTRPGHENVWYYGTGEYRGNSASAGGAYYAGDGLFKSLDGGQTWDPLPATSGWPASTFLSMWQYVYRVAVDPSNAVEDELYAAVFDQIMRSVDGGASWSRVLGNQASPWARYTDVVVSSTGVVYASLSSQDPVSGVFRSVDGINWTEITPPGLTDFNRIVLALAPSDENILYCEVADINGTDDEGFYKYRYVTGDGSGAGGDWLDLSDRMASLPARGEYGPLESYQSYTMMVRVHPISADLIFLGGVHLYRTFDAFGASYNTQWAGGWTYPDHHADQHELVFQPGSLTVAYTGSDGGVHKTLDALAESVVWTPLNNGYNTSQFYTVAIDEDTPGSNILIGGTQDNGSWFTNSGSGETSWLKHVGGDGGYCAVASAHGPVDTLLYSWQNGVMIRLRVDHDTGEYLSGTQFHPTDASGYLFINPFVMDPVDHHMVYTATNNGVWRNDDYSVIPDFTGGPVMTNWVQLTAEPPTEYISALAVSRTAGRVLYYGTASGGVYLLSNAATAPAWSRPTRLDLGPDFDPASYVSSIAIHPDDHDNVLLAVSNYNVVSIFHTQDGGATWTAVEGNLGGTDGPSVRDVAIVKVDGLYDPGTIDKDIYFAATSTGLYSALELNGADTEWRLEAPEMVGNVVVERLATRSSDGTVVAATHGKGVYSIDLGGVAPVDGQQAPHAGRLAQNVPNPFNPVTTIAFSLPEAGRATLAVYDVSGRLVKTLISGDMGVGDHEVRWMGTDEGGRPVAAGVYLYRLDSEAVHEVRRMTLVR